MSITLWMSTVAGSVAQITAREVAEATGVPLVVIIAIVVTYFLTSRSFTNRIETLKEQKQLAQDRVDQLKRENRDLLEQSSRPATPLSVEASLLAETTFSSVNAALAEVKNILAKELKTSQPVEILNLGLDLEVAQGFLLYELIHPPQPEFHDIIYRGVSVWSSENLVGELIDGTSNIKSSTARGVIEKLSEAAASGIQAPATSIEIRGLVLPPVFHGFLIAKRHLIISGTQVVGGKIKGGQYPYLYIRFDPANEARLHFIELFRSWFEYLWDKGPTLVKLGS